jgi:hypothetical protein
LEIISTWWGLTQFRLASAGSRPNSGGVFIVYFVGIVPMFALRRSKAIAVPRVSEWMVSVVVNLTSLNGPTNLTGAPQ